MEHWYRNVYATVADRQRMYTRREQRKALKARDFIKNCGYPTESEALVLVRDGNIQNIPHTVEAVKAFYDIYGVPVEHIKG